MRAQEFNQAWNSLGFTEDYRSTAKHAVHAASCILGGARIQDLCDSLSADNEEITSAMRSNFTGSTAEVFDSRKTSFEALNFSLASLCLH